MTSIMHPYGRRAHIPAEDVEACKTAWDGTTACLAEWSAFTGQALSLNEDETVTVVLSDGPATVGHGSVVFWDEDGLLGLRSVAAAAKLQDLPAA